MTRVRFPEVSRRRRIVLGVLLVVAGAAAAIAANFALLGLAEQRHDPVGKLSPRAVFNIPATGPSWTTPPVETGETAPDSDD